MRKLLTSLAALVLGGIMLCGQSLELEECLRLARENSVDIRNASLDVQAARLLRQEAFTHYFPSVKLQSYAVYTFEPIFDIGPETLLGSLKYGEKLVAVLNDASSAIGFDVPRFTAPNFMFTAGVLAMQPLYAGGRIVNSNRLAGLGVEAAELQGEMKGSEVCMQVRKDYWQIASLQMKRESLDTLEQMLRTVHEDIASTVESGVATETELMEVELHMSRLAAGRVKLNSGLRLLKMKLCDAIGQPYRLLNGSSGDAPFIDDITVASGGSELLPPDHYYRDDEQVVASRTETRLLELSVKAEQQKKSITMGEVLPTVGVGVSFGYNQIFNGHVSGAVIGTVSVPLTDWWAYSKKLQRHDIDIDKAASNRDYLRSQLLLQVRQRYMELTSAWDQLKIDEEASALSFKRMSSVKDHYDAGMATLRDLLMAKNQYQESMETLFNSRSAYSDALASYLDMMD